MRFVLPAFALTALLLAGPGLRAQEKPGKDAIKVIVLDRKEPVVYEKDIEPILINKCGFCHSGNVKEGKLDMGSFEGLMKGGKKGKEIVPGNASESRLVQLAGKTERPFMPPRTDEPLTPEELALIKLWIDQGAKPPSGARVKSKPVLTALPANVKPVRSVAVSPDKSAVAAGRANQIDIYDAGSGNHVRTLLDPDLVGADKKPLKGAHLSIVESMAYSPDGKFLASGSFQEVVLWDAQTGAIKHRLTGFADRVVALAFTQDSKLLATGGGAPTEDGEIKVFEVETAKQVLDIKNGHSDTVYGVCFSPDGSKLATCSADKFVKTFEIPSGKFIKSFEGHTHHVLDVGWRNDGKLLASGGADNAIKIWSFENGEPIRSINNQHTKQVTRLVFVGKTVDFVTCSGDQTVRRWSSDNGTVVRNFAGSNDFLYALGVSPDGAVVAAGGEEGIVRLYDGAGKFIKGLQPPGDSSPPKK